MGSDGAPPATQLLFPVRNSGGQLRSENMILIPTPIRSLNELWEHASIGPIPGEVVVAIGVLFHVGLAGLAVLTLKGQRAVGRVERPGDFEAPLP